MTPEQLRECPIDQCAENTDREIYRGPDDGCGDFYSDSLHITAEGALGIDCGGYVVVKPIRTWHGLAKAHAAALEEIERLNAAWKAQQFHLEGEERESAYWQERAEQAERRAGRLKVHAGRMRQILTIGDGGFPCRAVADYDAEFKGE